MSGNKKAANKLRSNAPSNDTPRSPMTLGFIVLVAGGFSTWYWYKPLPPEAGQAAYSDWNHGANDALWGETELIRPTLESLDGGGGANGQEPVDGLVGSGGAKLIPVPIYRKNVGDLLARESVPELPKLESISVDSPSNVQPWTNDPVQPSYKLPSLASSAPSDWPDLQYQPKLDAPAPVDRLSGAPSLLPASSSNPPRLIRTQDYEREMGDFPASVQQQTIVEPPRTPQIIRQPKRP